ncbi:MAG: cardiolipin synthase ClsB [Gammaproteobacteria bacterium]
MKNLKFIPGNRLTLLECGSQYSAVLESALAAARHDVLVETYIFADDSTGQRIARALTEAAQRNIAVYLLLDGFGSRNLPKRVREAMQAAGVMILLYGPDISPLTLRRERLRRLHRKLAVIDGSVAFVGGINITDDNSSRIPGKSLDYAVRIEGPLAAEVRRTMALLWRRYADVKFALRNSPRAPPSVSFQAGDGVAVALVLRDNIRHRKDIERAYRAAIDAAQNEIVLACAYFMPGWRFRHALIKAAKRGVKVTLLLQGHTDHPLLLYASRALYGNLLAAGVAIYEYTEGMLHAKVAVIDGRWATVGSSNLDPFSLLLSREANIVVKDERFAADLRLSLRNAIAGGAFGLESPGWMRQAWYLRACYWLAYGVARLLVTIVGYANEY